MLTKDVGVLLIKELSITDPKPPVLTLTAPFLGLAIQLKRPSSVLW